MSDQLKNIYLIYSRDRLFIDRALERLQSRFAKDGIVDKAIFYAREDDVSMLIAAANTRSLFAPKRLLILQNAHRLDKSEASMLEEYASKPSPEALVVLVALIHKDKKNAKTRGKALDQALAALPKELSSLIKIIDKYGQVFEFAEPAPKNAGQWLRGELKQRKVGITAEALDYVLRGVGQDFLRLEIEAEKISLYADPDSEVGIDDVKGLVSRTAETDVFELIDALSEHNSRGVFMILERLVSQNEPVLKMLNLIGSNLRVLLQIKSLLDEGVAQRDLPARLPGRHPYRITRFDVPAAQRFSISELKDAYSKTLEAEISIKTGKMNEVAALEILCSSVVGRG